MYYFSAINESQLLSRIKHSTQNLQYSLIVFEYVEFSI